MTILKRILCLGLMVSLTTSVMADETKEKKKNGEKKTPSATQRLIGKMELTAAQKEQTAAIDKEFADKLKELNAARNSILTAEQLKAEKEVNKANQEAGKKGKEAKAAIDEALKLTDEQKTKLNEHSKLQTEFNGKVIEALRKVLTPEQQEKLPKQRGEKGKNKKAN